MILNITDTQGWTIVAVLIIGMLIEKLFRIRRDRKNKEKAERMFNDGKW